MNSSLRTTIIATTAAALALTAGLFLATGPGATPTGGERPAAGVTTIVPAADGSTGDATGGAADTGGSEPGGPAEPGADAGPGGDAAGDEGVGGGAVDIDEPSPAPAGGSAGGSSGGSPGAGADSGSGGGDDEGAVGNGGAPAPGGNPPAEPADQQGDAPAQPEPQPEPQPEQPDDPAPEPEHLPAYELSSESLTFGTDTVRQLTMRSTGETSLDWSVTSLAPWLSVETAAPAVLAPGAEAEFTVRIDPLLTPPAPVFSGMLRFTTDAGVFHVAAFAIKAPAVPTTVTKVCTTKDPGPFGTVIFRVEVELSRPDALTMEVTGPNPKPVTVVVDGARAKGVVMLPGGARATSKLVLKPAKGTETVVPLAVGCTGSGADGSLALASARL